MKEVKFNGTYSRCRPSERKACRDRSDIRLRNRKNHSNKILEKTGINPDTRVKDLTEDDVAKLREVIEHEYTVEGDLRREVALNIKRLVEIDCYRGQRHRKGLPVRGQRTKTNARTRKGPAKTIANKKK